MEEGKQMWSLVREIVRSLVNDPDAVKVITSASGNDRGLVLTVTAAEGDMGRVIGDGGRTARSIRTIVSAAGTKLKLRCELVIGQAALPVKDRP